MTGKSKAKVRGVDQERSTASSKATAGRDLDALIAVKVMGWMRYRKAEYPAISQRAADNCWHVPGIDAPRSLPHFSTEMASAWEVVEKLAPHYIQQAFSRNEIGHWEIDWCVSEESYLAGYRTVVDYSSDYETSSLPLAICLAALRAVDAPSAVDRSWSTPEEVAPSFVSSDSEIGDTK